MRRSQNNRSVTARRAQDRPVSTDMRHFPSEVSPPLAAPWRNRRSPRMTATQRNGIGRRSEWNRSPYAPKRGWR